MLGLEICVGSKCAKEKTTMEYKWVTLSKLGHLKLLTEFLTGFQKILPPPPLDKTLGYCVWACVIASLLCNSILVCSKVGQIWLTFVM